MEKILAFLRDELRGTGENGRRSDAAKISGAVHPDRHFRTLRFSGLRRQGRYADSADQPLCRFEGRVRHVPVVRVEGVEVSDEHYSSVQRLLSRAAFAPGHPEGGCLRAHRSEAAAARRRAGPQILYSRA